MREYLNQRKLTEQKVQAEQRKQMGQELQEGWKQQENDFTVACLALSPCNGSGQPLLVYGFLSECTADLYFLVVFRVPGGNDAGKSVKKRVVRSYRRNVIKELS